MDSRYGAVVLCGGESRRMGQDKAWLPFGPRGTLLAHVVGVLQEAVPAENIVVVPGRDQRLPALPTDVRIVSESPNAAGAGPLGGLIAGLFGSSPQLHATFACGCDAPLLKAAFVAKVLELGDDHIDAVVPWDGTRLYPLVAAYRRSCLDALGNAFVKGERSLQRALRTCDLAVREVSVEEFGNVDPALESLVNCNTPEEYEAALRRSGFLA